MPIQKILLPILSLTLAVGLGTYLGSRGTSLGESSPAHPIVKTYQLSPERASQAQYVLSELFGSMANASAKSLSDGSLIVTFPGYYEDGVDKMVDSLKKSAIYEQKKVRMDYWVIRGSEEPFKIKTNLSSVSEVLKSIDQVDGKQNYQLLEHLSTNSSGQKRVKVRGWLAEAEAQIYQKTDFMNLRVDFDTKFGRVESKTKIRDGEFIILGQNAVNPKKFRRVVEEKWDVEKANQMSKIYYVIKAQVIE